jgi:hypothetical protein
MDPPDHPPLPQRHSVDIVKERHGRLAPVGRGGGPGGALGRGSWEAGSGEGGMDSEFPGPWPRRIVLNSSVYYLSLSAAVSATGSLAVKLRMNPPNRRTRRRSRVESTGGAACGGKT